MLSLPSAQQRELSSSPSPGVNILWVKQREETAQIIAKRQPLPQQMPVGVERQVAPLHYLPPLCRSFAPVGELLAVAEHHLAHQKGQLKASGCTEIQGGSSGYKIVDRTILGAKTRSRSWLVFILIYSSPLYDPKIHLLMIMARQRSTLWKSMETALSLVTHNEELDEAGEVAGGELAHECEESNVDIDSILSHDDDESEVGDGDPSLGGCVEYARLQGQG
ncbi:hypothetical protein GQ607_014734 [Colletotrichum asianum]|uniref:Uncharacterized protein n=1 Tax=Colletotrichum asianum TaxID=702518 RepID=A0A8H3ZJF5_9PEZI|nr:hypothetical protein GQ607_014734 [Colletotrichum asianum]